MTPLQVQVRLDTRSLDRWTGEIKRKHPEVFDRILTESGMLLAKTMRQKAPVRTGFLRDSIIIRKNRNWVEVGPTANYAPYVEFGTRPHIIEPVHASVLAFEIGGGTVFARRVHHPGFPGRFFVKSTKEECLPKIQAIVKEMYQLLFRGEA
ncbi:MAG: HK97 gp10 family phage protein [Candidatus Bathyarchaeia archaeon]